MNLVRAGVMSGIPSKAVIKGWVLSAGDVGLHHKVAKI
jgi:hypothetical protein